MINKLNIIEELKKDGWIIDLYNSFERYYSVLRLIFPKRPDTDLNKILRAKNQLNSWGYIYCQKNVVQGCMEEKEDLKNITELFNKYLQTHEEDVWFVSILSAMQNGKFVEYYHSVDKKWLVAPNYIIGMRCKYRVDGM